MVVIAARKSWWGCWEGAVARCFAKRKKKHRSGGEDGRKHRAAKTQGWRWKTRKKKRKMVKQKERLKVERQTDREIATGLRLADSCECRIWYCGTNTQTQACTYADAGTPYGLMGAQPHTHIHAIQKSYITHEILMMKSNQQKWRWDRQKEDGKVRKRGGWKQCVFIFSPAMEFWQSAK